MSFVSSFRGTKSDGAVSDDTFLSPKKSISSSSSSSSSVELNITPQQKKKSSKRKLDLAQSEDERSVQIKLSVSKVPEDEENCCDPKNILFAKVVRTIIALLDSATVNKLGLGKLHQIIQKRKEDISPVVGLNEQDRKVQRTRARLLIKEATNDTKTSIIASIVCDYVDYGLKGIRFLQHLSDKGDQSRFVTMVPTWSWQETELISLYQLGLSRFR